MNNIDFQNGFLCGMATKGMIKTGEMYSPIVWNDEGVYEYFYIDFKRAMSPFSTGMVAESIVVHDSMQLTVTDVSFVSTGIYKIFCNISNKVNGITVVNKKTSLLSTADGTKLPPFSTHFYVAGIVSYIKADYCYDYCDIEISSIQEDSNEQITVSLDSPIVPETISETGELNLSIYSNFNEAVGIVLT